MLDLRVIGNVFIEGIVNLKGREITNQFLVLEEHHLPPGLGTGPADPFVLDAIDEKAVEFIFENIRNRVHEPLRVGEKVFQPP